LPHLDLSKRNKWKVCDVLLQLKADEGTYQPSWVKHRYGAWYLKPRMWRRQPVTEPLKDPNDTKDKEMSEAKQKSLELVGLLWSYDGLMALLIANICLLITCCKLAWFNVTWNHVVWLCVTGF